MFLAIFLKKDVNDLVVYLFILCIDVFLSPFHLLFTVSFAEQVSIKDALHQLVMWGFDRCFATLAYKPTKKGGKSIVLIKDWQELLTEVRLLSARYPLHFYNKACENLWQTVGCSLYLQDSNISFTEDVFHFS